MKKLKIYQKVFLLLLSHAVLGGENKSAYRR